MLKWVCFVFVIHLSGMLQAVCANVHCGFEYLGSLAGRSLTHNDFMTSEVFNGTLEKHFAQECFPFRELDWLLFKFEKSLYDKNDSEVSNAVCEVSQLLKKYKVFLYDKDSKLPRRFPARLRMLLLEKIEYSLARMVLSKNRNRAIACLDDLLPDSIIDESRNIPSWHSILTFKRMLAIAVAVEDFHDKEGCYPLKLDMLELSEEKRKCACGRDIEYEYHGQNWILRNRCESYDGGLRFDEYIPMIYQSRKRLDLCFSCTFNKKRKSLFNGELLGGDDIRLRGWIPHDELQKGVHGIRFSNPSAGCGRIVPLSERSIP